MIADGTGNWQYLAIKSTSGLLRGVTSNHNGDYYCLNCFRSYTTEKKLRKHEKVCENHDFCHLKMPDEDNKILKCVFWRTLKILTLKRKLRIDSQVIL